MNIYHPKQPIHTVKKKELYIKLPFLGETSVKIEKDLNHCLSIYYPQIAFKFVHINSFKIGSFFPFKDKLPPPIRSSIIYCYECPNCQLGYLGSSTRALKLRLDDHIGRSSRTGRPLNNPQPSAIREHAEQCKCVIKPTDFKIIDSISQECKLRILESIYIKQLKPVLNKDTSALPLNIL